MPRRVGGWLKFFLYVIFGFASSDDAAFGGVVCVGLSFCLGLGFSRPFCGEFDPGSGRTLAACLTHASRTERPVLALVLEWRTGE